ncbi:protein NDNF [Schistocerca americana]|uniref:protein NDNF n=1 Tax=Schistocerca americana TaxID=7009 RepID=UPI001F4FE541|nr:protein NDNF [Schistocerca americana]
MCAPPAVCCVLAGVALALAVARGQAGGASRYRWTIPKEQIFSDNKVIPFDQQVSEFLYKGETKMFFLVKKKREGPLSITVTPCTSSLLWSVGYRNVSNDTEMGDPEPEQSLGEYRGRQLRTLQVRPAAPGLYTVRVAPLEGQSYVMLYATQQPGGPGPLSVRHKPRLKLQRRQRRKGLTVRWEPSSVDPHLMHYCLVVNPRRHYSTLCEARGERYGVIPPDAPEPADGAPVGFNFPHDVAGATKASLASKAERHNASRLGRGSGAETHEDIVVTCVGHKTQYTLCHLQHGKVYHVNLFAVNKRTNLSFPYGSTTLKYEQRARPVALRDGKRASVNLRHLDGRASFKFKVGRNPGPQLVAYVMACGGGSVDVRMRVDGQQAGGRTRVDGYARLELGQPLKGQRYTLQVAAPHREELRRVHAVEVLATTRPERFPLVELPPRPQLHEYESLRRCRSVTVGWLPSPSAASSAQPLRYCLSVRERAHADDELAPRPNQCALRRAPATQPLSSTCREGETTANRASNVTTHEVTGLEPGRSYVVQLTVQRPGGRPLSYDLLPVRTTTECLQ